MDPDPGTLVGHPGEGKLGVASALLRPLLHHLDFQRLPARVEARPDRLWARRGLSEDEPDRAEGEPDERRTEWARSEHGRS